MGTDRIVTLDVHNPVAFENAFRCRTVTATAAPLFVEYAKWLADQPLAVISPDTGGAKRAELFREALETARGEPVGKGFAEKHRSSGVGDLSVGEVAGATALVIDDLISTGTTLVRAARAARQAGASRVLAMVTHGLFMPRAPKRRSPIRRSTGWWSPTPFPPSPHFLKAAREKVEVLPVAPLLAPWRTRCLDSRP